MSEKHDIIMPKADFDKLVVEMRKAGVIVESNPLGYRCYEMGKHGLELIVLAYKGNGRYHLEASAKHFELKAKA